jgi:hypothetical protein
MNSTVPPHSGRDTAFISKGYHEHCVVGFGYYWFFVLNQDKGVFNETSFS